MLNLDPLSEEKRGINRTDFFNNWRLTALHLRVGVFNTSCVTFVTLSFINALGISTQVKSVK